MRACFLFRKKTNFFQLLVLDYFRRRVAFFFALRLATGALRLVTFRFLATLRFEVFLRDFFLVAIVFSVSGIRAEYIQGLPKIQQVT